MRPEPPITEVSAPFWEATRERRLVVQRCDDCQTWVWYPRTACTRCLGDNLQWNTVTGRGTVYACSVHHRPGVAGMKDCVPYVVALVELQEGVRLLSNIVGCDPGIVRIGQAVTGAWDSLPEGRHLPVFELA